MRFLNRDISKSKNVRSARVLYLVPNLKIIFIHLSKCLCDIQFLDNIRSRVGFLTFHVTSLNNNLVNDQFPLNFSAKVTLQGFIVSSNCG